MSSYLHQLLMCPSGSISVQGRCQSYVEAYQNIEKFRDIFILSLYFCFLFRKQIIKALIILPGCAGRSAPLLFVSNKSKKDSKDQGFDTIMYHTCTRIPKGKETKSQ